MNAIILHGKVTKAAELKLVYIGNEPATVAVFTVVDIGLPYQKGEPLFLQVNYKKEAANFIFKHLVENKEVLIRGILRQKFIKDDDSGEKKIRYFILAEDVVLLPVFPKVTTKADFEYGDKNE